ncbi:hypothetical protein BCV69DRAFT_90643 [Microstroma glucosiphilum]|uniref:Uncharacterized protein n=1 Tax=Pseudomicrostroma glucosiphilum TaxID=1684307 RepID=A0A316TX71_9BASI|nr:hypothetical protein BCV69DRAFT_90643 [Pseudomicrostroma glucosiphilum]PWN17992.1 hypothetical protein BCV69DRAFT_90643 [Pseudomicrostroma glucosiphilum]
MHQSQLYYCLLVIAHRLGASQDIIHVLVKLPLSDVGVADDVSPSQDVLNEIVDLALTEEDRVILLLGSEDGTASQHLVQCTAALKCGRVVCFASTQDAARGMQDTGCHELEAGEETLAEFLEGEPWCELV